MNELINERVGAVVVHSAIGRRGMGLFHVPKLLIRNLLRSRDLITVLFKRDFLAPHRKALLGSVWLVLSPLLGVLTWILLEATGLLKPGDVGVPYTAYVLVGSTMWGLFGGFYNAGSATLQKGQGLLLQVAYPHEVLIFEAALVQLANFLIGLLVVSCALLAFGVSPSWKVIFLPFVLVPMFLLAGSLGLIISLFSVVVPDAGRLASALINVLMFATPIVYSAEVPSPFLQFLIDWNPVSYLVCSARDIFLFGRLFRPDGFAISTALSLVLFFTSLRFFYLNEARLVEKMI